MKNTVGSVIIAAAALGLIKMYGEYKYFVGKCNANKVNKTIINLQNNLIKDMLEHIQEREEAEANN